MTSWRWWEEAPSWVRHVLVESALLKSYNLSFNRIVALFAIASRLTTENSIPVKRISNCLPGTIRAPNNFLAN
jgi:hypothetical protein